MDRQPPSSTRELIVDSAIRVLAEGSQPRLRRAVTIDEVAAAAGLARRTLYTHFETVDDLLGTALEKLGDPERLGPIDVQDDIRSLVSRLIRAYDSHEWRALDMLTATLGSDGQAAERSLSNVFELASDIVDRLAAEGRSFFEPFDSPRMVGLVTQLARTFGGSSDLSESEAVEGVMLALGAFSFRGGAEAVPSPGRLLQEEAIRRKVLESGGAEFPSLLRMVQDAALELFDVQGYADTTLDQVALACGLSVDLVSSQFGRKSDVARRLVQDMSATLMLTTGVFDSPDVKRGLSAVLTSAVALADEHPSTGELLLAIDPDTGRPFGERLLADALRAMGVEEFTTDGLLGVLTAITVARGSDPEDWEAEVASKVSRSVTELG